MAFKIYLFLQVPFLTFHGSLNHNDDSFHSKAKYELTECQRCDDIDFTKHTFLTLHNFIKPSLLKLKNIHSRTAFMFSFWFEYGSIQVFFQSFKVEFSLGSLLSMWWAVSGVQSNSEFLRTKDFLELFRGCWFAWSLEHNVWDEEHRPTSTWHICKEKRGDFTNLHLHTNLQQVFIIFPTKNRNFWALTSIFGLTAPT